MRNEYKWSQIVKTGVTRINEDEYENYHVNCIKCKTEYTLKFTLLFVNLIMPFIFWL